MTPPIGFIKPANAPAIPPAPMAPLSIMDAPTTLSRTTDAIIALDANSCIGPGINDITVDAAPTAAVKPNITADVLPVLFLVSSAVSLVVYPSSSRPSSRSSKTPLSTNLDPCVGLTLYAPVALR